MQTLKGLHTKPGVCSNAHKICIPAALHVPGDADSKSQPTRIQICLKLLACRPPHRSQKVAIFPRPHLTMLPRPRRLSSRLSCSTVSMHSGAGYAVLKQRVARLACCAAPSSEGHGMTWQDWKSSLRSAGKPDRSHSARTSRGGASRGKTGPRPSLRVVSFDKAVMPKGSSAKWS